MIGRVLDDRYVIRSRIARGGMATVYVANDSRLERRVAIKIMHGHLADDNSFRQRFIQEARSAARLAHPNVVNVFDQGQDSEMAYLVMEYLPGITLRDLLKSQQRLTADQAYEIGEAILAGLAAAHAADIMHRDLKPENVLLADDGRIKIGDFGLARVASANTTTGQALLGTIAYLSPELVTRGIADARSDVYAFGIMLFEMLTGRQPFLGEQPMQIAYQHAHDDVPAPSTLTPEATPDLDELVRWTTIRDPEARPRDAGIVLERLRQLRQQRPGLGGGYQATRVLTEHVSLTPSTTVLSPVQQQGLRGETGPSAPVAPPVPRTPLTEVQDAAHRRRALGRGAAAIVVALAVGAGVAGWWLGQGPGSRVLIPEVGGQAIEAAVTTLESHDLAVTVVDCPSLTVPAGQAGATTPAAGERVERDSPVSLCRSTGPELIAVPEVIGLGLDEARDAIESARFRFGEVTEERFGEAAAGTVLQTLDADGADLGAEYPEQGVINLVLSAGPLPEVNGASVDSATATLSGAGLRVDPGLALAAHSEEVPEGRVIRAVPQGETVRVGDAIGLEISEGPELFPVPDVTGMTVRQAVEELRAAGFTPKTLIPELLWNAVKATGTDPKAGEQLRAGAEVSINFPL